MRYISTRGGMAPQSFSDILLMGLAPDGGLVLPESYPQIGREQLDAWRGLSYVELAFEIIRLFATDIPADDLKSIIERSYTRAVFGSEEITPLKRLHDGLAILNCPMARRWLSRTWRCSCWAICSSMCWPGRANA